MKNYIPISLFVNNYLMYENSFLKPTHTNFERMVSTMSDQKNANNSNKSNSENEHSKNAAKNQMKNTSKSKYEVEPLPESFRPRQDGPGGN